MDCRQQQLNGWVSALSTVKEQLGDCWEMGLLSGDASFRRYFRISKINSGQKSTVNPLNVIRARRFSETIPSLIAVDAPPELEDNPRFVNLLKAWSHHGIPVPQLVAADFDQGFMLLSDLGDQQLLSLLNSKNVDSFYQSSFDHLVKIQSLPQYQGDRLIPPFDRSEFMGEFKLFSEWFVKKLLEIPEESFKTIQYEKLCDLLIEAALSQPQVCVHRDYHSRNLMVLDDQSLGVIDFQDAVWGPVTYDVVSLLRDCYVQWPASQILSSIRYFRQQAQLQGITVGDSEEEFVRWFDWMGIQRHLKAIGIFSRLWLRDGKPGYLEDIPRTLNYLMQVGLRYEEFVPFSQWLEQEVLPRYHRFLNLMQESES